MKNCEIKHYDLCVDGFNSTLFIIIDLADEIIGSCMLFHDGLLQDFYVTYKEIGFGTWFFKAVEEVAQEKGIKVIHGLVQDNNSALKFWKKIGFASVSGSEGWKVHKVL